ncbi:MAG: tryptophan--tRNA ligase [Candidatus Kapaibacteriales bacterium]
MESIENRKIVLSGVTPSGRLTLGHLTGALSNWRKMQDEFDSLFMVADLHAITLRQEPRVLRERTLDVVASFLACGIDPEKSAIFIQSHVAAHSQLSWVLSTFTGMGECQRMTQFKDKSSKNESNINVGLFTYPILMACDILLYQADAVPVGQDQKQHLELSRNLAQRFNNLYSPTFTVPEPYIPKKGGRIMSLQEPSQKMSKSDPNENATLFLTDSDDQIQRKIKRAVTDSIGEVVLSDEVGREGISNLVTIFSIATNQSIEKIINQYAGIGYGQFKSDLAQAMIEYISPIREKFNEYRKDKTYLNTLMIRGKENAERRAIKTLRKVYKKVGFYQP